MRRRLLRLGIIAVALNTALMHGAHDGVEVRIAMRSVLGCANPTIIDLPPGVSAVSPTLVGCNLARCQFALADMQLKELRCC